MNTESLEVRSRQAGQVVGRNLVKFIIKFGSPYFSSLVWLGESIAGFRTGSTMPNRLTKFRYSANMCMTSKPAQAPKPNGIAARFAPMPSPQQLIDAANRADAAAASARVEQDHASGVDVCVPDCASDPNSHGHPDDAPQQ